MNNESVKKTLEKSKNVLEEKRKKLKRKISIKKTNTFTKIAMNFVQEQLIEVKTPHVNEESISEKANFCSNTYFLLYLNSPVKKIHATKPLAFSLHFLFQCEQNHYSNLTSKIMKMCEQFLKKDSVLKQFKFFELK